MKKRIAIISIFVLTVIACGAVFGACTKKPQYKITDVYRSKSSEAAFSEANLVATFGEGVKPYGGKGSKTNYANAYVASIKCIVVQKTEGEQKLLGFYGLDGKVVLPIEYIDFSVSYGFITARHKDGAIVLAKPDGSVVFRATPKDSGYEIKNADGEVVALSLNFDVSNEMSLLLRPMSNDYVAIRTNVQKIAFARVSKNTAVKAELAGQMSEFKVVDNYIVRTFTENLLPVVTIYDVDESKIAPNGRMVAATADSILNVTYLGADNFYCAEMLKLGKESAESQSGIDKSGFEDLDDDKSDEQKPDEEYDYVDLSGNKCKISINVYNAESGKKTAQSDELIFSSIVNRYYEEESGLQVSKYLENGFSYVSVGLVKIDEKNTQFESFIIDTNGAVVASMTTNYGAIKPEENRAYRDLLIEYVDGVGVGVTNEKGPLALYDRNGKTVLFKDDADYSKISVNGNIAVALRTDKSGNSCWVAYGLDGTEIVGKEQAFTALTKFVGGYAIGVTKNYLSSTTCCVVTAEGKVYPSAAYASKSTYYYCAGAQVSKSESGKYGLLSVGVTPVVLVDYIADNIILTNYDGGVVIYYAEVNGVYSAYILK